MDLLLKNIGVLATPQGTTAKTGTDFGEILTLENAAVGIKDGQIVYIGQDPSETESVSLKSKKVIDCSGKLVTPGLVDSHTHLVFGGWRQSELAMKLDGVSYLEILQNGGGILSTVTATRSATEEELLEKSTLLAAEMLRYGTTTCECKSGYGLNLESEMKQLRVAKRLNETQPLEIVSTFMGAHAVPAEFRDNRTEYIRILCEEMLPLVSQEKLAEFCDVFCDSGAFTVEESASILSVALTHGLQLKAHVDEIDAVSGAEMAASLGCISAEHLILASDNGIEALSKSGTIACLLPATSFYLNKPFARAKDMIEQGVPVAIASDFNPGSSPNLNLQLAMHIGCLRFELTPRQVLTAATLNAAAAINRSDRIGSIEIGKQADIAVWNAPDLAYILYRYGSNNVDFVIKNGRIV